jgi:cobalamin biosynthesis protein CobT
MAASPQEAAKVSRRDADAAPPISMFDKAANVDEFNLAHAAERLSARNVSHRIIVVLADGMTRGSVEALADTAASIERGGTMVLGIGIGDETVQAAYARNQVVQRPDALASAMVDGVRSALFRSIADEGGDTWWTHATEQMAQLAN